MTTPADSAPPAGNHGRRDKRAVGWLGEVGMLSAANILLKLRGILLLPLITRLLGTAQYGIWIQAVAITHLASTISALGLRSAAVRLMVGLDDPLQRRRTYWSMFFGALALSLVGAGAVGLFSRQLAVGLTHDEAATGLFVMAALLIPLQTLNDLQVNLLRGLGRIRSYGIVQVVIQAGELILIAGALLYTPRIESAFEAMIIWRSATATLLLLHSHLLVPVTRPSRHILRSALGYSIPLVPAMAASAVLDKADRFVIGYYLGAAAVGIYGAAYTLAMFLLQLVYPLRDVLFPRLGRLWDQEGPEQVLRRLTAVWRYYLLLAIPAAVGLGYLGSPVLRLLSNAEIATGAGGMVGWIAIGIALYGANIIINQVFFAGRWTSQLPIVYGWGATVNITLNVYLVPRFGIIGAVLATVVCYLFTMSVAYRGARRLAGLQLSFEPVLRAGVAALAMYAALRLIDPVGWGGIIAAVAVGVSAYALALLGVGGLSSEERAWLRRRMRKSP